MKFADIKNDIAFRKIFGNEQKTAPLISFLNASLELEADKYQWSKEELKAYDNVTIKEQDDRGERELLAQKAKEEGRGEGREEGKEESKIEMILEMDKEGFSIQQIAKISKKSERDVLQIIGSQRDK